MSSLDELIGKVHCLDALELLKRIPDNSVDAVITDPPYFLGLDAWDVKSFEVADFVAECERVLKPTGFLAFTHQMPYMLEWLNVLSQSKTLRYGDHIAWVKRKITNPMQPIVRGWESLFIYKMSNAVYFDTQARWADISMPKFLDGLTTIEAFDRHIKDLQAKINGNSSPNTASLNRHGAFDYLKSTHTDRSPENANITNVWSFMPESMQKFDGVHEHASMKPVKMYERLCTLLTDKSALVADPFVGSGTTAVSARNTGRRFIVGDFTPEYVEIARKRLAMPYTPNMLDVLEKATDMPTQGGLFDDASDTD